jgi:two-component system, OmpR family, response regulator CpxR
MDTRPVLVVDDDPDIRETLRFVLEDAGYSVYLAANGKEALDLLASMDHPPGLILLDLMMPIMSGDEMLRALRAVHALAAIPVTIVTASGAPMPREATGILKKPVDLDALLRVVAKNCGAVSH